MDRPHKQVTTNFVKKGKKKARMYTINHAAGKTNYMFIMYDFTCFTAHFND